jgi:protein required for attachment to host cells
MKTWVVVASAARARVFDVHSRREPMHELLDLVNPQERMQPQELKSDKPGRAFDSLGGHRHALQTPVDPKEQVAQRFSKDVVDKLEAGLYQKQFDTLCVVAPPHFLGLLREHMSNALARTVKGDLAKDLTREDADSVRAHVEPLL